ncbi:MAG: hypothetical protein KC621_31250 [Myxococcales bacterium]|nr:hypothetical protein [Myxococcales bacterium]
MPEPVKPSWNVVGEDGACLQPTAVSELREALDLALGAWSQFDLPGLQDAGGAARDIVGCLGEIVGPEDVAAYWRVQGLVGFSKGDIARTELALAVARRVQPTYNLPVDLVPERHPLYKMWVGAASAPPPQMGELAAPRIGWLQVDGRRSTTAPEDHPYVFQWVTDQGVTSTQHVAVGTHPAYELPPPVLHHTSRKVFIGGVASAVVGGGAMVGAGLLRDYYNNAPAEDGELNGVRTVNLALGVGGIGLAVVGGGLGVGAVAINDW